MNKIVLKAASITVGVLAAVGILVFSLWILVSPQSMATVSERLGNYGFAVTCANLKYKYSGDSYDLARCSEDSILSGEDRLVVRYCGQLVEKQDFAEVCRSKDEELSRTDFGVYAADYRTYILGNLSVSLYRTGDLEGAIAAAEQGDVQCFAKLVIELVENGSAEDIEKTVNSLSRLDATEYVKGLIKILTDK